MRSELAQKIADNRQRIYDALKRDNQWLYRDAIHAAEAVSLNHNLSGKVAADIEGAVVLMVAQAIGCKP